MNQRVFYRQRAIAISQTWAKFCLVLLASFIIFPTAAIANEAVATFNRSEEHTSELQSQSTISYAVFCLKKKNNYSTHTFST